MPAPWQEPTVPQHSPPRSSARTISNKDSPGMDIERTFDLFDANIRSNANHIKSNGTCIRFESNQIRAPDSNRIVWGPRSFDWFDSQVAGRGSGVDW